MQIKQYLLVKKLDQKLYRWHTGHPGGLREVKYRDMMNKKPEEVVMHAVKGMLPKNTLGRKMLTNYVYTKVQTTNMKLKTRSSYIQ